MVGASHHRGRCKQYSLRTAPAPVKATASTPQALTRTACSGEGYFGVRRRLAPSFDNHCRQAPSGSFDATNDEHDPGGHRPRSSSRSRHGGDASKHEQATRHDSTDARRTSGIRRWSPPSAPHKKNIKPAPSAPHSTSATVVTTQGFGQAAQLHAPQASTISE